MMSSPSRVIRMNTFNYWLIFVVVVSFTILSRIEAQYSTHCSSHEYNTLRLYNVNNDTEDEGEEEGSVQRCYYGTWYAVCDYGWDCREANVACRQLGYDKARQSITNADNTFGYWSTIYNHYYYSCSTGSESSLTGGCSNHYTSSYHCHYYNDEAGVRCVKSFSSSCSHNGGLRLTGGKDNSEGVLEYCYNYKWTPFCSLDDEEAAVACKQMGFTKYAGFQSSDEYDWVWPTNYIGSAISSVSCSAAATENTLSHCSMNFVSSSSCATGSCLSPKAIKCHLSDGCTDGEVRLINGSISQAGRVEVCVDGIWGGICVDSWTKQAAYIVCKQIGYINTEPITFTNGEYGNGMVPLVYSSVDCNGWELSITECSKTNYLHFTCSSNTAAGVLCPDGCVNGDVRLIGSPLSSEGTVEVCANRFWGLISEAAWDGNDAKVICRQLNLPFDGAYAVYDSYYGKPDRTIHYSYVLCNGDESSITSCNKVSHTLGEGRQIFDEAVVAGVVCQHAKPAPPTPPCVPLPVQEDNECQNGELQIDGDSGLMQYCIEGEWSLICQLTHNETTVACRQLGYTSYTWGLPYSIDETSVSSGADSTLISSIKCTSNELSLKECSIVKQRECMKYCETVLGLQCYHPSDCVEGLIRLADGIIDQEGRVEVCLNGVWSSICDNGWDQTDAHVVCQQMGFSSLEPLSFGGDHFGPSNGPIVYSNVDCGGWEESIVECAKTSHLDVVCSHDNVAGIMCSDDCSDGDVRLMGGEFPYMGTVEVCFNNLWGLVNEDGWGLADANVTCRQLGYDKSDTSTVGSSLFGHPNKIIHIGNVECDGSEPNLSECPMKRYSIDTGKNMSISNSIGIAGVVCHVPVSHVTSRSTSRSTTSSTTSMRATPSTTKGPVLAVTTSTDDYSTLMIALIALVCVVILMLCLVSVVYFVVKLKKRRKRRQGLRRLPVVTYSSQVQDNEYDSVTDSTTSGDLNDDTKKLVNEEAKGKDEDITFGAISKENDDHVYEIPMGIPSRTNTKMSIN